MRTIKFRGFNPKNECWIYGYYFVNRGKHFIVEDGIADPQKTWEDFEVKPESIGQFTGQFDMNGTEIYEGDFVFDTNGGYCTGLVQYGFFAFSLGIRYWNLENEIVAKVVGNLYENPELEKDLERFHDDGWSAIVCEKKEE